MQARSTIDRRLLEDAARLGVDRHPSVGSLVSGLRHRVPFDAFAVTGLPYADKGIGTGTFLADDWSKSARLEMAQRRWYKRSPVVYALRGGMTRYTSTIEDEIVLQRPELGPAGREMREALGREVAAFPVRLLGKVAGSVTFRRRSGLFDPDELDLLEMVAPALHAAAAAVPDALGRIALTPARARGHRLGLGRQDQRRDRGHHGHHRAHRERPHHPRDPQARRGLAQSRGLRGAAPRLHRLRQGPPFQRPRFMVQRRP